MITTIALENFKRFHSTEISLRSMTVLTGVNGGGKSSLLQAILLARYATEHPTSRVIPLNGPYGLALGEAYDILHPEAGPDAQEVGVVLRAESAEYHYRFEVPTERSLNLLHRERPDIPPDVFGHEGRQFAYLTAERLGPREQLEVTAEDTTWLGVGERGQFTAQVLAGEQTHRVRAALQHPNTAHHGVVNLLTQVEEWIGDIVRRVRIQADWPPGLAASILRFSEAGWMGEPIRPANIGFGFSYALPIVVAGLLMPAGGMLIVENPEAHLHPAGQSHLGRFLARVAGSGTQVLVETHSDHLVNGIRLGIAADQTLASHETILHYFDHQDSGSPTAVEVTPRGELTSWPDGFFDQIEHDLRGLARAKRRRQ